MAMLWKGSRGNSRMSWKRAGDTVQTLWIPVERLCLFGLFQKTRWSGCRRHTDAVMVLLPQAWICSSTSPREGAQHQVAYRR